MGKDSISNILYILGIIGCIMVMANFIYYLALGLPVAFTILMVGGYILIAVAFIGFYRDFENYFPLLVTIMWILMAFQPWAYWLGAQNLVSMGGYTIVFLLMGYSVYLFREPFGSFATLASIIFIIWGFVQFVLKYLGGWSDPLLSAILATGFAFIYFIALIYFYLAMRN